MPLLPPLCYTLPMARRKPEPDPALPEDTRSLVLSHQDEEVPDDIILSPKQAMCIAARARGATIHQACEEADIHYNTWYRWKTTDPMFQRALQRVTDGILDQARAGMDDLQPKVTTGLEAALDAKSIPDCPSCKQPIVCSNCDSPIELSNFPAVLRAIEMMLKRQGELVNRTHVTGEQHVKHTQELSHEQRLALGRFNAGLPIPPEAEAELRHLGLIAGPPTIIEAEASEASASTDDDGDE